MESQTNIQTYRITEREAFSLRGSYMIKAIECLRCGMVSHNPNDIDQKYCGNCHKFHEDPQIDYFQ